MLTGIDHVIVAVADPDAAVDLLASALGLTAAGGGQHAQRGTYNRLVWLGDSYLELMGVFDESLAADSWWGRHALTVLEGGEGYMGVALASHDLAADVERLRASGSTIGQPEAGERLRPDGRSVRWRLAHFDAPDPEFGLVFLIEHEHDSAEWTADERAARAVAVHSIGTPGRLRRLELPVSDARAAPLRLLRDLGLGFRPSLAGHGARDIAVGGQTIRLVPGLDLPVVALAGGRGSVGARLLGCDWLVESAGG